MRNASKAVFSLPGVKTFGHHDVLKFIRGRKPFLYRPPANDSFDIALESGACSGALSNCKIRQTIKSSFDKIAALIALAFLLPFLPFLAVFIRADGGPVFYNQIRIGKNGRAFKCWKIRSMVVDADRVLQNVLENDEAIRSEWVKYQKLKNDPRITKIGGFIRKFSIDELPQLYNVLRGDMSLVGPRPILKRERTLYGKTYQEYLSVKPGITGLWQVSGRNKTSYAQRVALDSRYIREWSLAKDFVILFKTVHVVLGARGAH